MVELGVFLRVLNNGWVISTAAPQYQPSYAMHKAMTLLAEDLGFSFVLSPVKYRGFGRPTEQWDYVLESFEVMAALAEATDRIRLYGTDYGILLPLSRYKRPGAVGQLRGGHTRRSRCGMVCDTGGLETPIQLSSIRPHTVGSAP